MAGRAPDPARADPARADPARENTYRQITVRQNTVRDGTDDSDVGWGEPPEPAAGAGSDDWYRRECPPHHDA